MIFELLNRAIEQKNSYMSEEMLQLQVEFFYTAGRLTDGERATLNVLLDGSTQNTVETTYTVEEEMI